MPDKVGLVVEPVAAPVAEPIKEVVEKVEPVHLSVFDKVEEIETPMVGALPTIVGEASVGTDEEAEIVAVEDVREQDVQRSQFDQGADENDEQGVCRGDARRSKIGEDVFTRRTLPGSKIDLERGVDGDVKRDGEETPTPRNCPGVN